MKVLVSDSLGEAGLEILRKEEGIELDVKTGLHPEELKEIIENYDGLIIRSATKVSKDIISAAKKLKVVGRAGVGLDNVDIPFATQKGIVVMNTPGGNTIAAAEHTIAMMMALSRNIPQATSSMKKNLWEKKKFQGREVFQKTIGIIGFGHIGSIVADRARGLKMTVLIYDPNVTQEFVEKLGFRYVSLDELFKESDYITVHTPKIKATTNLFNKEAFNKMKKGVMLLNCARGGIVNEADLFEALKSGKVAGAALDVFETEPPADSPLLTLDKVIATPHLGASTEEAQTNVAVAVAEQIVKYLKYNTIINAVNVPSITGEKLKTIEPFILLADKIGLLQAQMIKSAIQKIEIEYTGTFLENDSIKPITNSFLKGLLTLIANADNVNFVNASIIANNMGIKISESIVPESDYTNLISIKIFTKEGENIVKGTIFGKNRARIVRVNNFFLEMIPYGNLIYLENYDKPGVIGSVGTLLGNESVNIDRMTVGRESTGKNSVIFISTERQVSEKVINSLIKLKNIISAKAIDLGENKGW